MSKPLIILGAGGFAREAFQWMDSSQYHVIGFFLDEPKVDTRLHAPQIHTLTGHPGVRFLTAVGDPIGRQILSERAMAAGLIPCDPIIHSTALVGDAKFGRNIIICPGSVITTDVVISDGALINLNCTVGHDAVLDKYVTLSPGVNVSGNVRIGTRSYLGTNSSVRERVQIGSDCFLGMGAVLIKDMPAGEVWTGIPARLKK